MPSTNLTKEAFKELWKTELLPSIRSEIRAESTLIQESIKALKDRCLQIEKPQEYISSKYDELTQAFQLSKKQASHFEESLGHQEETIAAIQDSMDDLYNTIDDLQQYSRRDCLEVSGITKVPNENLRTLITELGALIDVKLTLDEISTVHRLPDTVKIKDRLIVKFTRRDKRNELYSSRRKLHGKTTKDIPSLAHKSTTSGTSRIFINESLTANRRRLFSRVNDFKKAQKFKFIWTQNGKIHLKQSETARAFIFTKDMEFEEFLATHS